MQTVINTITHTELYNLPLEIVLRILINSPQTLLRKVVIYIIFSPLKYVILS